MNSDVDEPPATKSLPHERRLIRTALAGMTVGQLKDLQTTGHRLQHLPFPKLVEALFAQQTDREAAKDAFPFGPPHEHNFSLGEPGRDGPRYLRELFEDLAAALRARKP